MAEALAVVGIIANIVALIDLSVEVYERAQNFRDGVNNVPKAFQDVHGRLPLLKIALQKTKQRASNSTEKEREALKQTLQGCHQNIEDLYAIFKKVLPADNASRLTRGWKAVSSLGQDKKVEAIDKAITGYVGALTFYHSSEGASVAQIIEAFKDSNINTEGSPREPLFMVRYQEEGFIGRTAIMQEIAKRFGTSARVAIAGIGGVGKSRIAIEYCYQYHGKNPDSDVFWVHGGNKTRLEAAYKEIATKMNIPGVNEPNANALQLVSDWLSQKENGSWLMVLDNADDYEIWAGSGPSGSSEPPIRLADYIPRGKHGQVLITTRNTQLGKALSNVRKKPIEVPIFGSDEAVELLRSKISEDDEMTDEDAIELTKSLDHLSLAITQAAAFLDENEMSVAEYLELVRSSKAEVSELLSRENHDDSRDPEIQNSVFQTWKISFDLISRQAPCAADMLSLMAMLDRQAISTDLLRLEDEKELDFIEAIKKLKAFSLIIEESKDNTYSMHRIVQLSIQWHLEIQKRSKTFQEKALGAVDRCFPPHGDYEYWSSIEDLNPHAQIVLSYQFAEENFEFQQARLMHVLGYYHGEHGFYSAAVQYLSDSIKLYEKYMDSGKADIMNVKGDLAFYLNELNRYDEAEKVILQALEMSEKNFPEKPDPGLLGKHALILARKGNYQESEHLFQQALDLSSAQNGSTHSKIVTIMHNLAILYHKQDRFSEAEKLFQEVLNMHLDSLRVEHPNTIATMGLLASTLGAQQKFDEQEKLLRDTVSLQVKLLGPSNPQTLTSMHNLAHALKNSGNYKEAETLAQETMSLESQVLGPEHENTLNTMDLLAGLLADQERLTEAEDLYKKTLKLMTKVLGAEHKNTLATMYNLGSTLYNLEKYEEAKEYEMETLRLRTKVLGAEDKSTLTTRDNLARTLRKLGECDEAEQHLRETLRLRTKVLGGDHKDTLATMHGLGYTLNKMEKYEEAEKHFRETLRLRTKVLGGDYKDTLGTMHELGVTLYGLEKYEEAKEYDTETLRLKTKVLGSEHKDTLITMYNLTNTLRALGEYEEAKELAEKCVELHVAVLGQDDPWTLDTKELLARIKEEEEAEDEEEEEEEEEEDNLEMAV